MKKFRKRGELKRVDGELLKEAAKRYNEDIVKYVPRKHSYIHIPINRNLLGLTQKERDALEGNVSKRKQ